MPYDSFLIDPFLLFIIAFLVTFFTRSMQPEPRKKLRIALALLTAVVFWGTSVSLYFNLEWTRWIWEMCYAASGRDWMINSGVFHFDYENPGIMTHVLSALCFVTYPIWYGLGFFFGLLKDPVVQSHPGMPRFAGQSDFYEVWYITFSDEKTGDAFWFHFEMVSLEKLLHKGLSSANGFFAYFPKNEKPACYDFGPFDFNLAQATNKNWLSHNVIKMSGTGFSGQAGNVSWDFKFVQQSRPLFVMPRWLWETGILGGAHMVYAPHIELEGMFATESGKQQITKARGEIGRIFGKRRPVKWIWIHADLGHDDVLEVLAVVPRQKILKYFSPLTFVKLRMANEEWPKHSGLFKARFKFQSEMKLPFMTVTGHCGDRRITVSVNVPPDRSVTVTYADPDNAQCVCTNSELASAHIILEKKTKGVWQVEKEWEQASGVHAELGQHKV